MEISAGARAAAVAPQVEPSPDPFSAANADSELDTYHKDWMEIDWIEIDDFIINLAGKGGPGRLGATSADSTRLEPAPAPRLLCQRLQALAS